MGSRARLNLVQTTAVGVGAIVGGGIFVLAGPMIAQAGPSALIALLLNGLIALMTAMSFAEMATAFPENGGEYVFARRALSVRSAFAVGWVVWFAYAVAAALYALGFSAYFLLAVDALAETALGANRVLSATVSVAVATAVGTALARWGPVGGVVANVGKVAVFGFLIAAGLAAFAGSPRAAISPMSPFMTGGGAGILAAMGLSFIILQGFGNIAAVAGNVDKPARTLPRAMFLSLAIAIAIYGPILFLTLTVGVPEGISPTELAAADPEGFFAVAVENWLGDFGWWLVIVAALLAMASALQANLMAAAGVGRAMALDRTLPRQFAHLHVQWGTPAPALALSIVLACGVVLLLPDPSSAGAAASLIFLLCFSLVHLLAWMVRRRLPADADTFRAPFFPLIPMVGGLACLSVALYQVALVPVAGWMTLVWLGFGLFFYFGFLSARAEALDSAAASRDPEIMRSRGNRETALVPIASPENAANLAALAGTLVPPGYGHIVVLQVIVPERNEEDDGLPSALRRAHSALDNAVIQVHRDKHDVEFVLTVAEEPWSAIRRLADERATGSVLLGLPRSRERLSAEPLNALLSDLQCDVALLCAAPEFRLSSVSRVLVPIGGSADHDQMRARVLGAMLRHGTRGCTFLRIFPEDAPEVRLQQARDRLERLLQDEVRGHGTALVTRSGDPAATIIGRAADHDLVLLGATRGARGARALSPLLLRTATGSPCATLILSRRAN